MSTTYRLYFLLYSLLPAPWHASIRNAVLPQPSHAPSEPPEVVLARTAVPELATITIEPNITRAELQKRVEKADFLIKAFALWHSLGHPRSFQRRDLTATELCEGITPLTNEMVKEGVSAAKNSVGLAMLSAYARACLAPPKPIVKIILAPK